MKKLLALLALVLGVVSCQTEPEGLDVNVGGEIDAIVNVTIPEVETRAAGSDSALGAIQNGVLGTESDNTTLRYILQVYYKDGENYVQSAERLVEYSDGKSVAFDVRLVPQRNYQFVVWADVVTDGKNDTDNHYVTKDANGKSTLDNITLNGDWNAMDESRDAFTASEYIDNYNGSKDITITLKRPFAKLRVVTTDIKNLTNLGIVPHNAVVEYTTNHRVAFNALAGVAAEASEAKTHTFELAQYTNESNTGAEYTLFTDYFFAENDIVKFDLTVKENGGKVIGETVAFNTDINVKRNYLTTIKGNILTDGKNFNVTINDAFTQPNIDVEYKEASTAQELVDIIDEINNSTTDDEIHISLNGDINLDDLLGAGILSTRAATSASVTIAEGKEVVLDIKDYTITGTDNGTASFGLFNIQSGAKLTIEGNRGSIKLTAKNNRLWDAYSSVISNQCGEFVLNGGTIEHLGGTDMAYGIDNLTNTGAQNAKTTINGGVVKSTYRAIRQFLNSTLALNELIVNGGTIDGAKNKSIWMQNANSKVNPGKLVVAETANLYGNVMVSGNNAPELAIELSLASAALKEEATVVPSKLPAGYSVVEENGVWVVKFTPVAKIGEKGYGTLAKAVAEAQNGDTIEFIADVEQVDGVIITDKNITIDLGGKTFTVSEGATTNNRNFKVNGSSIVTIKNGTMVAAGDYSSGAYGTLRTEGSANVTLENVKLYNYRGNGLNVKALGGTTVTITDTEIYSQYGGGVEAAGGTVELTDVKIEQKGMYTAPYNSMAISVNGGGQATVNSGTYSTECITAEEANNQGTSHGPWCAGVLNSGGALIIKGGTFSNDNYGDNALATYARGLLLADTAANIQIEGGVFNAVKAIIDVTNNLGDASRNPSATISGGDFSADPCVSGLYASHLISVAEGFKVENNNGRWTVVVDPAAKIGNVEYATLQEAFNVGGEITLLRNVAVAETVVLAEGKTVILDLNGKTLSATDMNTIKNNGGVLTIKNGTVTRTGDVVGYSVNNASGEITVKDATIKRGLYTSGSKMTATNANISHEQSSRHAIYAWSCEVTINSGTYHNDNAGNATLMATGSSVVTINGGTFSIADGRSALGWTSSMIDQNSTAQVIVKGGLFNGGFRINSADTTLTIEGGEFNTNNGSAFTDYSGIKVVKGGKFTDAGAQNWAKKYIAEGYEMNANGEVVAK